MNIENCLGSKTLIHSGHVIFDAWDLADYLNSGGQDITPFKRLDIRGETLFQFGGLVVSKGPEIWEPQTESEFLRIRGLCKCGDCLVIGEFSSRNDSLKKICKECAEKYRVCFHCGQVTKEFDGVKKPICRNCRGARYHCGICDDHHVGPCIKTLGSGFNERGRWPDIKPQGGKTKFPFYAGMELEINTSDSVKTLQMIRENYPDLFWGTRDGTVEGIELVSMPATLEYWQGVNFKFFSGCREGQAGIHVHVDRLPHEHFQLAAILEFFFNNKAFVYKIAERETHFAKINSLDIYKKQEDLTGFLGGDKYSALNFCHRKTLEYRIFNSTLNLDHIKKDVEFCFALWDWTRRGSFQTTEKDFTKFCHSEKETFPYLSKYIERTA